MLGCLENAKSLKSQAPQGFSGCLDIYNRGMVRDPTQEFKGARLT